MPHLFRGLRVGPGHDPVLPVARRFVQGDFQLERLERRHLQIARRLGEKNES